MSEEDLETVQVFLFGDLLFILTVLNFRSSPPAFVNSAEIVLSPFLLFKDVNLSTEVQAFFLNPFDSFSSSKVCNSNLSEDAENKTPKMERASIFSKWCRLLKSSDLGTALNLSPECLQLNMATAWYTSSIRRNADDWISLLKCIWVKINRITGRWTLKQHYCSPGSSPYGHNALTNEQCL